MYAPLKPISIKERVSVIFVERGEIDMLDGAFVVVSPNSRATVQPSARDMPPRQDHPAFERDPGE